VTDKLNKILNTIKDNKCHLTVIKCDELRGFDFIYSSSFATKIEKQ